MNITKVKKLDLTKSKKSISIKFKKTIVITFLRADFLLFKTKILYRQKAFTKTPILYYFNSKCCIWIETNTLGYAIIGVKSLMTLDEFFSNHIAHENSIPLKSKIY